MNGGAEQGPADRQPVAGLTDADEAPEPQEDPVTQDGDVWILGEHRLRCGDATDAVAMAGLFTALSLVRSYFVRRLFNRGWSKKPADDGSKQPPPVRQGKAQRQHQDES